MATRKITPVATVAVSRKPVAAPVKAAPAPVAARPVGRPAAAPRPSAALAAPSTPVAPLGRPGIGRPAGKPAVATPGPTAAPPVVSGFSAADKAALMKELADTKAELSKLNARVAATQSKTRTVEQIVDGGDALVPEGDWRLDYQGATIAIRAFEFSGKKGAETIMPYEDGTIVQALLAIPRSGDVGGEGDTIRAMGRIAVYTSVSEEGTYSGPPCYISTNELAAVWPEEA